jgi:hypothetical protein
MNTLAVCFGASRQLTQITPPFDLSRRQAFVGDPELIGWRQSKRFTD